MALPPPKAAKKPPPGGSSRIPAPDDLGPVGPPDAGGLPPELAGGPPGLPPDAGLAGPPPGDPGLAGPPPGMDPGMAGPGMGGPGGPPQFPSTDPNAIFALLSGLNARDQQMMGVAQLQADGQAFSQLMQAMPDPAAAAATGMPAPPQGPPASGMPY